MAVKMFIVSGRRIDGRRGFVQYMEAATKSAAQSIARDINGAGSDWELLTIEPGQSWPRAWRGPKMYPPKGWKNAR